MVNKAFEYSKKRKPYLRPLPLLKSHFGFLKNKKKNIYLLHRYANKIFFVHICPGLSEIKMIP